MKSDLISIFINNYISGFFKGKDKNHYFKNKNLHISFIMCLSECFSEDNQKNFYHSLLRHSAGFLVDV